jgi:hypothetical protein
MIIIIMLAELKIHNKNPFLDAVNGSSRKIEQDVCIVHIKAYRGHLWLT